MPRMPRGTTLCVCVPTYNEAENLEPFATAVLAELDRLGVRGVLLVVDDNSPDGTGAIADRLAAADRRVYVLHREEKNGLGEAYKAAFAWTRRHRSIKTVVQMDCDFSHDPGELGRLLEARADADVVLGSRYVAGGRILDWPWWRRMVSRGGSWYARRTLGVRQRDLTGGFKCFAPGALARIPLNDVSAAGYGFQIETTWRALRAGLRVAEVPITFRDRTRGSSKMSLAIAREAALMVPRLRWAGWSQRTRAAAAAVPRAMAAAPRRSLAAVAGLARAVAAAPLPLLAAFAAVVALATAPLAVTSFATMAYGALSLEFLITTVVGVCTLTLMLYAWRDGASVAETGFPASDHPPRHAFSLILPARHEEAVLPATLRRMAQQRHPNFEVIVVVGDDDPGTTRAAHEAVAGDPRFRVVVDGNPVKSKPRALNTALPHCRGDVVGVFDAEDQVAPGLLTAIDRRFQQTGADVVQGAVQLMNYTTSWYSVRNVLEYYFWFKSRLHFHAREGFIPLGGNTVFVERRWLVASDGWDSECLAEDCDLGARLSALGARTVVAYSPELVTREETPATLGALLKQRTRWNQGFLQVLRKGTWRSRSGASRALALYTLSFPIVQALLGLSVPLALAMALLVKLPIVLALLSFLPLAPLAAILVAEVIGLAQFCREFSLRARPLDYLRLVVGSIPYQLLLCAAAARAAWRELRGINNWEKTAHVGAHL
jgi:cellulose synthase/poly-beta-1,6-N-acetylglucosamine synthase-like glycosyltransferase/GT2 family glycosyltransferase